MGSHANQVDYWPHVFMILKQSIGIALVLFARHGINNTLAYIVWPTTIALVLIDGLSIRLH